MLLRRYRSKVTGDYSGAIGLSDAACEVRSDNTLGVCTEGGLSIRDANGDWLDVLSLFDSRQRHLSADKLHETSRNVAEVTDELTKRDAALDAKVSAFGKRAAAMASRVKDVDSEYNAGLKQVEALLAKLSASSS